MDYGIPCHSSSVSRSSRINPTAKNPIVWSVPFSQRIHASATSFEEVWSGRPRRDQVLMPLGCWLGGRTHHPDVSFNAAVTTCSFSSAWWEHVE